MRGIIGNEGYLPLFETNQAKGRLIYRAFVGSIFMAILMVWVYRITQMPSQGQDGRWAWIGLFGAELWFSLYWVLTQNVRWNLIYHYTFKDRLSLRYEAALPKVDIFVCTADPDREPPILVVNTVLSVMAYDYPPEKLSIYVSDDGGSILTFYALFEASYFSKHWLPYCRKYNVEPRSPSAYFSSMPKPMDATHSSDFASIKDMYEEMHNRIKTSIELGRITEEIHDQHKGFSQWKSSYNSRGDHDTILQTLIDGRDSKAKDVEGCSLPTLVYLAREKRPQHFHNFKAGALNALIRVSSKISNGPIILNVDCDMYSNNSQSIRDALCFFMDEKKSHNIAFVQSPQAFENITKNDIYGASIILLEFESAGMDALGGAFYVGTGCFHQREILSQVKYMGDSNIEWKMHNNNSNNMKVQGTIDELEEKAKALASCTYEINSQWGKEISSLWFIPFGYIIVAKYSYSLGEFLFCGGTTLGWWNEQRMWLYKRLSAYLFAFVKTMLKVFGFSNMKFVITSKVVDENVTQRYEKELMEFGVNSSMFIILETIALLNLLTFVVILKNMVTMVKNERGMVMVNSFALQILLCGVLVFINLPLYGGVFIRSDKGKMPISITIKATFISLLVCTTFVLF